MKFGVSDGFHVELRRRVETFFRTTGRQPRDCWQMYVKTGILVALLVASYLLLVLGAQTWWQALPLAMLLGLAAAGIGFNVQHDGGHQAYSSHPWINTLMALTLDLIGGSSYVWNCKHVSGTASTPSSITRTSTSRTMMPISISASSPA
jgi:linoleoyl-CoA desaturase